MQKPQILTISQARNLMLVSQNLAHPFVGKVTKQEILKVIRKIHVLQLDTINVVARAHHHILWSRLGAYNSEWLYELHAEGHLFEYFAHAASYLPVEDYPIYRSRMKNEMIGWKNIDEWGKANSQIVAEVLEHIRVTGGAKSADFIRKKESGGWWNWKEEKAALEFLYYRGDLMISRREGFQRVYDLRERVLPDWDDVSTPDYSEALQDQVLKAIKALGVAREDWIANYFYLPKNPTGTIVAKLESKGEIIRIRVEGLNTKPFYVHRQVYNSLQDLIQEEKPPCHTTFLSPFAPLITDRSRAMSLFGFNYQIECYIPAPKRVYGYFVLPILYHGRLIGRMDAKAWRKEKRLQVIKLFLEPYEKPTDAMINSLKKVLWAYAAWQGLEEIQIDWTKPTNLADRLA